MAMTSNHLSPRPLQAFSAEAARLLVGKDSGSSTHSTRTPTATPESAEALPADHHAFRRRASSKDIDSSQKPQSRDVPRAPLTSFADEEAQLPEDSPLPKKALAAMFNQVSEAKAQVEAEPRQEEEAQAA